MAVIIDEGVRSNSSSRMRKEKKSEKTSTTYTQRIVLHRNKVRPKIAVHTPDDVMTQDE